MKIIRAFLTLASIFVITPSSIAETISDYSMDVYDKQIQQLYKNPQLKTHAISERIAIISQYFLGRPYLNGALGEGKKAEFDQEPLYRTDAFDCLTYVSTVLALALSNNLAEFQKNMLKIQYRNATPAFINRLHFTSVDWNNVNEKNGFIQDITHSFRNTEGKPISKMAYTLINKPAWYQMMTTHNLKFIVPLSSAQEIKRLDAIHQLSQKVIIEKSAVPYLPLTALFNADREPNMYLFDQIPSGAIIEIVRPNWDLEKMIGTHLNISHLGFAIRTSKGLFFREASSLENKITDVILTDYLKNYLDSTTVKGINVQIAIY